jgi:excinuclease ABC subunit A
VYGHFGFDPWFLNLDNQLSDKQKRIAMGNKEMGSTELLMNVGFDYLALSRSSKSLQVVKRNTHSVGYSIGSQLVGVLYWMNQVLVYTKETTKRHSLEQLRDIGNSVIVSNTIKHD